MATSCSGGRSGSTRFELLYVLGNLAGLFVTGTTGQTSDISILFRVNLFRKAAEIRNDLAHNLLKHYWSAGPRGGYHGRCYLTCTSKRNLKYFQSISEAKVSKDLSNIADSSLPYIFSKFSLTL
jgi:hypothetical protein